jgi:hypothetical protein
MDRFAQDDGILRRARIAGHVIRVAGLRACRS